MDFQLPPEVTAKLAELDAFIEAQILPLQREHMQFFDHRRGIRPHRLGERRPPAGRVACADHRDGSAWPTRPATCAWACRKVAAGRAPSNLMIAAIREHLAGKGLGLHNDLQDESSIVGNFPIVPVLADYGTAEQKQYIEGIITGKMHLAFGLTEPGHGSDATWLETTACGPTTVRATGSSMA